MKATRSLLTLLTLSLLAACSSQAPTPQTEVQGVVQVNSNKTIKRVMVSFCDPLQTPIQALGSRISVPLGRHVCTINAETDYGDFGAVEEEFAVSAKETQVTLNFNQKGLMVNPEGEVRKSASTPTLTSLSTNPVPYNPYYAVSFAVFNYNRPYSPSLNTGGLPGTNCGNNCTQFISLSILAGLLQTFQPSTVDANKTQFVDKSGSFWWYWVDCANLPSDSSLAPLSFIRANNLYRYANAYDSLLSQGINNVNGLYFQFVTRDSTTAYLDVDKIQPGDVVFEDDPDFSGMYGVVDHAMLVTTVNPGARNDYGRVLYTQQSDNKSGASLAAANSASRLWYVYRPRFWNY